jgi:hypothetical protein
MQAPISLFYSYSHKDEELRQRLELHLAVFRRSGMINEWHDREIKHGEEWLYGQVERKPLLSDS